MSSPVQNQSIAEKTLRAMTNTRIAINKLERANSAVQRFSNSDNKMIGIAAHEFSIAYDQLIAALNQSIQSEEKLLSVSSGQESGALLNETSKWAAEADEAWKLLVYATVATCHTLTDNTRLVDGKLPYLTITTAERNELLVELEQQFGESIKGGIAAGQHATEAAPAALRDMLNRPWKPSDSS